jgi:hypothetical protein
MIGWANSSRTAAGLEVEVGHAGGRPPRERAYRRELEAEIERIRTFLR